MSEEEKTLSPIKIKISQECGNNEVVEEAQLEIEVRLNQIEGLKPLLPKRNYGQKWVDLDFEISAQSLIERNDPLLAFSLELNSGYWEKIEKTEKSHFKYFDEIDKNIEELLTKESGFEIAK